MFAVVLTVAAVMVFVGNPVTLLWAWLAGLPAGGVWSLVTATASITGLFLQRYDVRLGWWVGIPTQFVWIAGGIVLSRPGDIALSVIFITLYVGHLRRTRGQSMTRTDEVDDLRARHAIAQADNAQLRAEVIALRTRLEQCPDRAEAGAR